MNRPHLAPVLEKVCWPRNFHRHFANTVVSSGILLPKGSRAHHHLFTPVTCPDLLTCLADRYAVALVLSSALVGVAMVFVAGRFVWKSQVGTTVEGAYDLSSDLSSDPDTTSASAETFENIRSEMALGAKHRRSKADPDYEQPYAFATKDSNRDATTTKATRSTTASPRSGNLGAEYAFATSGGTGSAWDWDDSGNSLHAAPPRSKAFSAASARTALKNPGAGLNLNNTPPRGGKVAAGT